MDYLLFIIEVEHVYWRHLRGCAAWPCWASGIGMLHQMSMWVLLHEHVLTLAWAVVCLVTFRSNDPVPAKSFKVHCKRVSTTAGFCGVLITVKTQIPPWSLGCFKNLDLQEWLLEIMGGRRQTEMGQAAGTKKSYTWMVVTPKLSMKWLIWVHFNLKQISLILCTLYKQQSQMYVKWLFVIRLCNRFEGYQWTITFHSFLHTVEICGFRRIWKTEQVYGQILGLFFCLFVFWFFCLF